MKLLEPLKMGNLTLPNRVFMAPLTRCRAGPNNVPHELNALYYAQRASAGLIITEATQVSPRGVGYPNTPGIHTGSQVEGWKLVTKAVHEKGGRIFLQLWHVGRVSHPSYQPNGDLPISSSAVAIKGNINTPTGKQPYVAPRALELSEIPGVINEYREGAKNAKRAGFDGVEIHGANGYLIDQFIRDGVNIRTDRYGGSLENRARFALEVVDAVTQEWESKRVGIRLSPNGAFNGMSDSDPKGIYGYLLEHLKTRNLGYVHIIDPMENDQHLVPLAFIRTIYTDLIVTNSNYTRETAEAVVQERLADAVAFGKLFLANPDLPERFKKNAALNVPDAKTFYGGGEHGYTDYPSLA